MEVPGNTIPVTAEGSCQVAFSENSTKEDSANHDYNENQNPTTLDHSNTLFNIPIQSQGEYEAELVINEEIVGIHQSKLSLEPYITEKRSENTVQDIAVDQANSSDLEAISLIEAEQIIVTTLSEVINCENDSMITTACIMHSSNDLLLTESEGDTSSKVEDGSINSTDSILNESLPSFIGEIDESVSTPPAEPLILEQDNNHHERVEEIAIKTMSSTEIVNEDTSGSGIVTEDISSDELTENAVKNEIVTQNIIDHENITENAIEITAQDENLSNEQEDENVNASLTDTVTGNVTVKEVESTEEPQTEIITTTASNIQYTVLPPGENAVYQEDGTLVVEYPLDVTAISTAQSANLNEIIAQDKSSISDPSVPSDQQAVQIVEKIVKQEGSHMEMVEAPLEEENIPAEAEASAEQVEKPQQKRRGRKATGGIPPHIVGHPVDKQDVINGKAMKARLGVKIPYRKLASQIVSTSELQNHIVERARLKEEARSETEKTNLFTKKLTHRLAQSLSGLTKKDTSEKSSKIDSTDTSTEDNINIMENILTIIPTNTTAEQPTNAIEIVEQIVNVETGILENVTDNIDSMQVAVSTAEPLENANIGSTETVKKSANIESNSDLIAILEGDGEESATEMNLPNVIEIVDTSENASEIKAIEKEISLTEQKSSNPTTPQVKEKKFFKTRESRVAEVSKDKTKESASKPKSSLNITTVREKFSSVSHEEKRKDNNIFDVEHALVTKGEAKCSDSKRVSEQAKASDKGKSSGTVIEVEPQLKPAMVLKTYTRKRKSNDASTPEPAKKPLIMPSPSSQPDPKIDCVTPAQPNVYITKSSRVIKKKVIWDPDEAMPSVRSQSKILSKIETASKATPTAKVTVSQKQTPAKAAEKKISDKEKQVDPPKIPKMVEKKPVKTNQDEKEKKIAVEKPTMKKPEKVEAVKKVIPKSSVTEKTNQQTKVVITSSFKISPGKSPKRSTKRLSEIDKLLMDEGAVNMLYDINNSDDQKRRVSGRTGAAPTDKAQNQKELLNRTLEIKNELTQGTIVDAATPKTLRKKEGPPPAKKEKEIKEPSTAISRKMSKDSTKSSNHSPPPSPAVFTPAEASRIIRRHSSSSFSSTEGLPHRESLDTASDKEREKQNKKKETPAEEPTTAEEPMATEVDANIQEEPTQVKTAKKRSSFTPEPISRKKYKQEPSVVANGKPTKPTEIVVKSEPGVVTGELKTDPTKAFTVIKMNKHYMINLSYFGGDNYMSVQLLKDLVVTIRELERTRNCSVVSINSQGPAFCLGIDYKELVDSDEESRNMKLTEMSHAIRDFLKCLLNFSKIIVAGVKGDCIGLGVTMLPLFDMIVATDTASFCTPYAKIGCPPEAGFLLSIPYQSNHGLASELLYTAQRMNADEAQRRGLVTKLFWPEKFDSEFRTLLSHISNLSKPALMVTKKQLRQAQQKIAETEISTNCKLLIKYWNTLDCQRDFENYNALTFDMI